MLQRYLDARCSLRAAVLACVLASVASGAGAATPDQPAPRELIIHFDKDHHAGPQAAGIGRRVRPGVHVVAIDSTDSTDSTDSADSEDVDNADARAGAHAEGTRNAERWRRLHQSMENWRRRPGVRLVEPNYYGRFDAVPDATPPDDPQFANQWWLGAVGALGMWPIGQGRGIKIALVDSGVSLTHPDLTANLEADGYDFGDNDSDPSDGLGHGTEVAGVLAAAANNGVGIAGMAPAVRVLPIKVSDGNTGQFGAATVAQAVDYAVSRGARVINLSLTFIPDQTTELLSTSIQAALDRGIAVVAAAGNSSSGGGPVQFPANMPGVIAVAATERSGGLFTTSARGPEITIAAPGADILTTKLNAGYGSLSGTSFATPMASGAIAALMSINPSLPVATLVSLLQSTATPIPGLQAGQAYGQLHAGRAAASLLPAMTLPAGPWTPQGSFEAAYRLPPLVAPADLYVTVGTPVGEFSLLPDCAWSSVAAAGYRPFARGYSAAASRSGVLFGPGGVCAAIPLAGLPAGTYNWRVAATQSAGSLIGAVNSEAMEIGP